MEIKLLKLEIENFKGIGSFCLNIGGESALVAGRNGTGKTTIVDAWLWLLTGSNSDAQAKFNVLELDGQSAPVDHQDAVVSAALLKGNKTIKIKKIFRQKWVKKRGQAQADFTGHTTDHYFEDVPISAKVFSQKLAEIADPEILRALSDVHHFCGRMKPDDRRAELLKLVGDVTPASICIGDLAPLLELLAEHDIDDLEKIQTAARRTINDQLKELPARIDELRKSIPDITGMDEAEIRGRQKSVDDQIAVKKNELIALTHGEASADLRKRRAFVEAEMIGIENKIRYDSAARQNQLYDESNSLQRNIDAKRSKIARIDEQIEQINVELEENESNRAELKEEYHRIRLEKFTPESTCFACGQILPDDQISVQSDHFNQKKAEKLAKINESGIALAKIHAKMTDEKKDLAEQIEKLSKEIETDHGKLKTQTEALEKISTDIDAEIEKNKAPLLAEIADIEQKLDNPDDTMVQERNTIESALSDLQGEYYKIQGRLADIAQADRAGRRIKEREADLKEAATEFEKIEQRLYLIELYRRRRSEIIEENVSRHFELIRWKLFEEQVNQGVREICEPTLNGVPYSTDLNDGAKINAGLDTIQTLQRHYGIKLPVFVDNAESITDWMIDMHDWQVIRLMAAAKVDELEVIIG